MNGTSRRLGVAAGAVVVTIAMQACGSGAGSSAQEPVPAVPEADVHDAAGKVEQLGRERFPERYAGLEISDGRIVVYRKPSAEFDAALGGLGAVEPRDAPYSAEELQTLADRIAADIGYWQDRGIEISSVGARQDGTAVEVGTPQPAELSPLLPARYGSNPPAVATAVGPIVPAG